MVFDRGEWEEVITFFAVTSSSPDQLYSSNGQISPTRDNSRLVGSTGRIVNYVKFIETVLDSSQLRDLKSRLFLTGSDRDTDTRGRDGGRPVHTPRQSQSKPVPQPKRIPSGSRGATVSITSPEFFMSSGGDMSMRSNTWKPQSGKLRKTITGRYQNGGSGRDGGDSDKKSELYSPVVGGSDTRASSPWGSNSPLNGRSNSSLRHSKKSTTATGRENNNSRENSFKPGPVEEVKLTQKQFAKAKQMKFGNAELRALEDLKVSVSEALDRRPIPKGKGKADVLREWLDMEDSNRSRSLSKNSVIATLNALGLPYESWSTPSQRNLIDFLATRGGGTIMIDDLMALIGSKL